MQESDNSMMYKCFEKLNDRLFEISKSNLVESYHNPAFVIDGLRDNGIHGLDPEDLIDEIIAIKGRILELKENLPSLVKKLEIKAVTDDDRIFDKSIELVDPIKKRNEILEGLRSEIDFYLAELDKHYEFALKRVSTSSAAFANAGIKIKFNLTVEEMGTLFKGLIDANVIKLVDGITDQKIEREDFANWVSKNCSSKFKSKDSISTKNLYNSLNYKKSVEIISHLNKVIAKFNESSKS